MTHTCTHVHRHAHILQAYQHTSAGLCLIVIIIMIPIPIPFARLPAIFCLSVSQSLSQCYQMKFASKCGTWQRCDSHRHTRTHAHTHTHSKQRLHRFRINAEKRQRKGFHFQQSRGKDSLYQDYRSNSSHKSQFCLLPNYLYAADNAGRGWGALYAV